MNTEVPPVPDERSGLLAFLAQQRRMLRTAAYGLTGEQLRAAPSVSTLSVGALLKHVTYTERGWIDRVAGRPDPTTWPDYDRQFELSESDTVAGLLAAWDTVATETESTIAAVADLDQPVPVPRYAEARSVRWVLLHLIEEIARHAGHADIIRESLDGATATNLLAATEAGETTV
jgi:uncharacterized damage-inducible protein DinB